MCLKKVNSSVIPGGHDLSLIHSTERHKEKNQLRNNSAVNVSQELHDISSFLFLGRVQVEVHLGLSTSLNMKAIQYTVACTPDTNVLPGHRFHTREVSKTTSCHSQNTSPLQSYDKKYITWPRVASVSQHFLCGTFTQDVLITMFRPSPDKVVLCEIMTKE